MRKRAKIERVSEQKIERVSWCIIAPCMCCCCSLLKNWWRSGGDLTNSARAQVLHAYVLALRAYVLVFCALTRSCFARLHAHVSRSSFLSCFLHWSVKFHGFQTSQSLINEKNVWNITNFDFLPWRLKVRKYSLSALTHHDSCIPDFLFKFALKNF